MSLADQLKGFHSERADVVSRNLAHARPSTTSSTPARTSTPQPAKRAHDAAFSNSSGGGGSNGGGGGGGVPAGQIMKIVVDAVDRLRKQSGAAPTTFAELIRFLSLPYTLNNARGRENIKTALKRHHRITYLGGKEEEFKYRPLHPVTNGDELRNYLATLETAQGILVKELKDGWPDCIPTLDLLESEGHILVHRKRKDNTPLSVYPDNPSWHITTTTSTSNTPATKIRQADPDFTKFWSQIRLPPNENDIRKELESAGLTPTSAVREASKVVGRKKERKRVDRKNAKKTNTHMAGILKDYSKMRPGGK